MGYWSLGLSSDDFVHVSTSSVKCSSDVTSEGLGLVDIRVVSCDAWLLDDVIVEMWLWVRLSFQWRSLLTNCTLRLDSDLRLTRTIGVKFLLIIVCVFSHLNSISTWLLL